MTELFLVDSEIIVSISFSDNPFFEAISAVVFSLYFTINGAILFSIKIYGLENSEFKTPSSLAISAKFLIISGFLPLKVFSIAFSDKE